MSVVQAFAKMLGPDLLSEASAVVDTLSMSDSLAVEPFFSSSRTEVSLSPVIIVGALGNRTKCAWVVDGGCEFVEDSLFSTASVSEQLAVKTPVKGLDVFANSFEEVAFDSERTGKETRGQLRDCSIAELSSK